MTETGNMTLEDAAAELVGNWKRFASFAWHRRKELEAPDSWAIIYTHHRDSRLLDLSNASVIAKTLELFSDGDDPDVVAESHSHWAVGHIDGFSIRVFKDGEITPAFKTYHALAEKMANYPILSESDYSQREYDATIENIGQAAYRLKHEFDLPEGWEGDVFSWFWDHKQSAVENRDDQGGYPSEADLREAFDALGYRAVEDAE